jgi:hypothetical protein
MSRILEYQSRPPQTSRFALGVFIASIVGASVFFMVVPSLLVFAVSLVTAAYLNGQPQLAGRGYLQWAIRISLGSAGLGLCAQLFMPCGCGSRELSNRSVCAANLRGIMQSLNVYANDNADAFPIVAYAPYSPALNNARAATGPTKPEEVLAAYYASPRQAGSPQAILWQLVLRGDIASKSLICKSDPFATGVAKVEDSSGACFDNFQDGRQLSYSVAYPWKADGAVGPWWRATNDATLPLMSDVAPQQGTGDPTVDVTSLTPNANSRNHRFEKIGGQNVVFADSHVEFAPLLDVGQNKDNIFTTSGIPSTGPASGGYAAAKSSPSLNADRPPYDILMLPIRNESTGGFE